jgi:hypothetical protein
MAKFRTLYRYKQDYLTGKGFLPFESRELARNYNMSQIRSLPYLQNVIKARGLFISGLRKRGYKDNEIRDRIYTVYDTKDWLTDGKPDIWQMLRRYRKKTIEDNDYIPPKRKGSHHKGGISKGDLQEQRKRRKAKSFLQKYDEGRGR